VLAEFVLHDAELGFVAVIKEGEADVDETLLISPSELRAELVVFSCMVPLLGLRSAVL